MLVTAARRKVLFDGRTRIRTSQNESGDLVSQQNVQLVWLGIAVLALVSATLQIWRARRALNRSQHDSGVTQIGLAPAPVAELTSSAIAS